MAKLTAGVRQGRRLYLAGWIGVAVVTGLALSVNLYLAARSFGLVMGGAPAVDWQQYLEASRRIDGDALYAVTDTYAYHYSPLMAYLFVPLAALGTIGWRLLHVLAAITLPTWPMRTLAVVSWPFWYDVEAGNLLVFVVWAAAWALRGSRWGIGSYLVLFLVMPRPLMLPLAVWLLWSFPGWRLPFAVLLGVHSILVAATGLGGEWISAMMAATGDMAIPSNIGPSRFVGAAWLLVGVPLATWLTWRGRIGLASLAISLYWLPYYLMMLLLELSPARRPRHP